MSSNNNQEAVNNNERVEDIETPLDSHSSPPNTTTDDVEKGKTNTSPVLKSAMVQPGSAPKRRKKKAKNENESGSQPASSCSSYSVVSGQSDEELLEQYPTTTKEEEKAKDQLQKQSNATPNHHPATKAPKDTLKAVYAAGKYKANLKLSVLMMQSFMAGVYIASSCQLVQSVGGGFLGAAIFPGGLLAVVLTSAELFTGDALVFVASVLGGEVKIRHLLRNWCVAWMCNFLGSVFWAVFFAYLSGAVEDSGHAEFAIKLAEKKALHEFYSIFLRGIGANFLVCVAIWCATCAEEVTGKAIAIWFPVMGFVVMGFDHCVANMYIIPSGMLLGANISVGRLFAAIFVASAGNVVGGGIFVGAVYWYVFDTMQHQNIVRAGIAKLFVGKASTNHHHHRHPNDSNFASFFGKKLGSRSECSVGTN